MSNQESPLVPDWEQLNIPVDDSAEPDNAEPAHTRAAEEDEDAS